jgi:hypothetical protein
MVDIHVAQEGRADGQGTESSPLTLREGVERHKENDRILCKPGLYQDQSWQQLNRQLIGAVILSKGIEEGKRADFRRPFDFQDSVGVKATGIGFLESGSDNFFRARDAKNLIFDRCFLGSTDHDWEGDSYSGAYLVGCDNVKFLKTEVNDWVKGDFIRLQGCKRILFKEPNFSKARGGHSIVNLKDCSFAKISGDPEKLSECTNPWDRFFSITQTKDSREARRILIENLILDRVDWDGESPHPYDGIDDNDRGAGSPFRFCVTDGIVRNCAIVYSQLGKQPKGALQFTLYSSSWRFRGTHVYNCVIHDSWHSSLSASINPRVEPKSEWTADNTFTNVLFNGFDDAGEGDFYGIDIGKRINWKSWKFRNCSVSDLEMLQSIRLSGESGSPMTVGEASQRYPEVFRSLRADAPIFVNEEQKDFRQAATSPLRGKGRGVSLVTASGEGNRIPVDDNRPFCDGWGVDNPDEIIIDGKQVRVIDSESEGELVIDQSVQYTAGQPLMPLQAGKVFDIGIFNRSDLVPPGNGNGNGEDCSKYKEQMLASAEDLERIARELRTGAQ